MATKTMSKNGTRPAYELGSVWRWVEYPAKDVVGEDYPYRDVFEGFAVEVLWNPKGADERAIQFAAKEYERRLKELAETDPDNQDLVDAAEDDYLRVLAPRIRAWNATQDGIAIPAPGETDDPDAFMAFRVIPEHLKYWAITVVRMVTIPKRQTRTFLPAGSTATGTQPTTIPPEPEPQAS